MPVIFLTVFIDLLGFAMVLPLLPIYADQFTVDERGWVLGALMAVFSLMQLIFAPLWGRLSDRIGRRPVLMIGLLGSVVFYALFGIATVQKSLLLLFVARIGAGIAGATVSTAQAYIADCTTVANRHKGMALIGMAFGLGFTLGPVFGFLAVPDANGDPGPWPGYAASILSAVALLLAWFRLPESLRPDSQHAERKILDPVALKNALSTPSIGMILLCIFVCLFSFANFETTLGILIKGGKNLTDSPWKFSWGQICLTYAFIGFTLALVQGGIVRRLAGKIDEGKVAVLGAVLQVIAFMMLVMAVRNGSEILMFAALVVVVTGFSFLQPSLNSLLSRRTDPSKQGSIMGLGQSVNALARIVGSLVGIPLLKAGVTYPYFFAAGLMMIGAVLVTIAARRGKDFT